MASISVNAVSRPCSFPDMLQGVLFHEGLEPLGIAGTALVTGASLLNLCVGRPRARTKKRECI